MHGKLIKKRELMAILNFPVVDGYLVEGVDPWSPAEKAGVRSGGLPVKIAGEEYMLGGDIITAANGKPLNSRENFEKFVRSLKVGEKVRLTIYRKGKTLQVEVSVKERPILPWDLPPIDQRMLPPAWNQSVIPKDE